MKDENLFKDDHGDILKRKMIKSGLCIKGLAERIEYSQEGVRRIFNNNSSYRAIQKVCKALNFEIINVMKEV